MSSPILLLLLAVAISAVTLTSGCSSDEATAQTTKPATTTTKPAEQPIAPPSTQPATLTGTLRGGMMAIGGETSGWSLVGDGAVGGIELDVSKVKDDAKRLDGKRITVSGRWVDKKYVERGTVRQLAVDRMAEAK